MQQALNSITENFENLELCKVLDKANEVEVENFISEAPEGVAHWISWFMGSTLDMDLFRVRLKDKSYVILKKVSENQFLLIHNIHENITALLGFLKTFDLQTTPEVLSTEELIKEVESKKPDETNTVSHLNMLNAQRIQQLIIPSEDELQANFKNFFVVHQQQDIVGGDFYWYHKKGDNIILSLIDCTGHSIEGAMTSMVCNSLLNQTVEQLDEDNLSLFVRDFYQRLETYNRTTKDMLSYGIGAEIGVFSFNMKKKKARFSSTGIAAFLRKGDELELIKAKKFLDYSQLDKLEDHVIDLDQIDGLYCFTDGLIDQFDEADDKKLGYKGVKNMINKEQSFNAKYYSDALNSWKGDNIQYDDITMIGIAV